MALTICNECKKSISNSATRCPHCGAVGPQQKSMMQMALFLLLFGLFCMFYIPYALITSIF